jgi:hypothetical protein
LPLKILGRFGFLALWILVLSLQASAFETLSEPQFVTDMTWTSKYMINGFKVADNPAFQFTGKAKLGNTGFSAMYWNSIQTDRNDKSQDEHDLFLLYSKEVLKSSKAEMNLHGYVDYWVFPNSEPVVDPFGDTVSTAKMQGNNFQVGVSFPSLIPVGDSAVVPTYNIYYVSYWAQGREDQFQGGIEHELALQYDHGIRPVIPGASYQYFSLVSDTFYNQGTFEAKPGLSHTAVTILSGVYALKSIFTASLNHQWTLNSTVNSGNEVWTTLSYIKKF